MTFVSSQNSITIPKNTYYAPVKKGHELSSSDDFIIDKGPTTGIKTFVHKMYNNVAVYTPKGLKGSRNSNFYEFLSLGTIPYLTGSAMLVASYAALILMGGMKNSSKFPAKNVLTRTAMGVALYGTGKWLNGKILNKLTEFSTGIDLDMTYKKTVTELPEGPGLPEKTRNEYHKVFESADFFRSDLLLKKGESMGNRWHFYDKITKKMKYQEKLNAPDQAVDPIIRETIVKATAAKSVSGYLWAALGVVLSSQDSFGKLFTGMVSKNVVENAFGKNVKHVGNTFKKAFMDVWRGHKTQYPKLSGALGKALIIGAFASTALGWANIKRGFHMGEVRDKSEIDFKKDYEGV